LTMPLYFLVVFFLFWVPGAALMTIAWKGLTFPQRKSFWITSAVMAVASFGMEYVYLWADIWSFSEAHDPLLGITVFGAPIEEFAFWFGATPFCLSLYLVTGRFLGLKAKTGAETVKTTRVARARPKRKTGE